MTHAYPLCHCDPALDAGVGNLVAVATAVCRRVFNLNEIATWFDRLTMSGCAPRNDSRPVWINKVGTREHGTNAAQFALALSLTPAWAGAIIPAMTTPTRHPDCQRPAVAIDGPVASGKSSVGRAAAEVLRLRFLDTGIMYRAVTWLALHRGIAAADTAAVAELAGQCSMSLDDTTDQSPNHAVIASGSPTPDAAISIDGHRLRAELVSDGVDRHVSAVAAIAGVRTALVKQQRAIANGGGIIVAGRDIGSVVLPQADVKLYIDASVEERARRRFAQLQEADPSVDFQQVLADTRRRDWLDSQRADSPLLIPSGAIVIDTDSIDFDRSVAAVIHAIRSAVTNHKQTG